MRRTFVRRTRSRAIPLAMTMKNYQHAAQTSMVLRLRGPATRAEALLQKLVSLFRVSTIPNVHPITFCAPFHLGGCILLQNVGVTRLIRGETGLSFHNTLNLCPMLIINTVTYLFPACKYESRK